MTTFSRAAKLYIVLTLAAGLGAFVAGVWPWRWTSIPLFSIFLVGFVVSSELKVRVPGIQGTMSASQLFVFLAIVGLSRGEALALGCIGALVQTVWSAKSRPTLIQTAFNFANMALSVAVAYALFHLELPGHPEVHLATRLVGSATAFFLVNTLLVSGVIALTERKSPLRVWVDGFMWSFGYYLIAAGVAVTLTLLGSEGNWQVPVVAIPVLFAIYYSYRQHLNRLEGDKKHAEENAALHLRIIEALAAAIEAKDTTTHDHLERVQVYAMELGRKLKLDPQGLRALQAASLLHDIGKLAVPEHIISKPGKLTREEFEKMKIHPVVGAAILERVGFPYPVVPIVRHHHEKWDGSGYPDGLRGEEIPIGARILSVVDCLDALASDRQYRRALPPEEVMSKIATGAGTAFDPAVVEVLAANYQHLEEKVRQGAQVHQKLETNIHVARGHSPAAGLAVSNPERRNGAAGGAPGRNGALDALARAREELAFAARLCLDPGSDIGLEAFLMVLDDRLRGLLRHDAMAVYLVSGGCVVPWYVRGTDAALFAELRIPLGKGISGWVVHHGQPMLNGNPAVESAYLSNPARSTSLRSAVSVPLPGVGGKIGALTLYHRRPDAFAAGDRQVLAAIAGKVARVMERVCPEERARILAPAPSDGTRRLIQCLDASLTRRPRNPVSVVAVEAPEARGRVLQEIEDGLRVLAGEGGGCARTGTSAWIAALPGSDALEAHRLVAELAAALGARHQENGNHGAIALHCGIATAEGDNTALEALIADAERRVKLPVPSPGQAADGIRDLLALASHTIEEADEPLRVEKADGG